MQDVIEIVPQNIFRPQNGKEKKKKKTVDILCRMVYVAKKNLFKLLVDSCRNTRTYILHKFKPET